MIIDFPTFGDRRCLMMPYIQGDPQSVPEAYAAYAPILASTYIQRGQVGFLTIDESHVPAGTPHRGARARHGRALHTEAGILHNQAGWGDLPGWGGRHRVTLDHNTRILLANSVDRSCAVWDAEQVDTSEDGDIGHLAHDYPYDTAEFMRAGEVREIGIFTPHESLPVSTSVDRQFLRIIGVGVHGRESYFTTNPLVPWH